VVSTNRPVTHSNCCGKGADGTLAGNDGICAGAAWGVSGNAGRMGPAGGVVFAGGAGCAAMTVGRYWRVVWWWSGAAEGRVAPASSVFACSWGSDRGSAAVSGKGKGTGGNALPSNSNKAAKLLLSVSVLAGVLCGLPEAHMPSSRESVKVGDIRDFSIAGRRVHRWLVVRGAVRGARLLSGVFG